MRLAAILMVILGRTGTEPGLGAAAGIAGSARSCSRVTLAVVLAPEPVSPPPGRPVEHGPSASAGQPSAPGMTLAELEEMALGCNPTLAQAAARVEAARGRCVQVGLYPNPVAGYMGSEIGNEGRAGQQGGFVSQEIVTAGKLQLNRSRCQPGGPASRNGPGRSQRLRVLTDVRRSLLRRAGRPTHGGTHRAIGANRRAKASNPPKH